MKLALLGRHIQHSLSPTIYKKLINANLSYKLLDYENGGLIPSLDMIFDQNNLDGLNITAPYKSHFIANVSLKRPELIAQIGGINCIKKDSGIYWGENTDEMAFRHEFDVLIKIHKFDKVVLIGDGTMANMVKVVLQEFPVDLEQFSRKVNGNIDKIKPTVSNHKKCIFINACSRDYTFRGPFKSEILFWDMNYQMSDHEALIPNYVSGERLLCLQAKFAIEFFSQE